MNLKRTRLIEIVGDNTSSDASEDEMTQETCKRLKANCASDFWLNKLRSATKYTFTENQLQRVRYKFQDGTEMVEEYNVATGCATRRAWRKSGLSGDAPSSWRVELGELDGVESEELRESSDQPRACKRNTRINIEWRIRNLPYPVETYSVKAEPSTPAQITVKTSNCKFYKKLMLPELTRVNVLPSQQSVSYTHARNTLIVTYKKPEELCGMEKAWFQELQGLKQQQDDSDCNIS